MITFSNYDTEITKIPISKAPEAIQNGHAFYGKAKELYSKSDAIKKTIDLYITKLNEYAASQAKSTPKDFKVGQSFEVLKNNVLNAKKGDTFTITEYNDFIWVGSESFRPSLFKDLIADKVIKPKFKSGETGKTYTKIHFDYHVKLAKRFVSFIGKPKTLAQVENLHKAVQKAVVEGYLPTTEYFKIMVEKTPKMLEIARKVAPEKTTLEGLQDATEQTKLVNFANAATKWPSVNLIKRYITIANTTGKVDAAKITRLETSINSYVAKMNSADPFSSILKKIAQKGINSNAFTDFRLNGLPGEEIPNLQGIANYLGCACQNINFAEPKK